MEIAKLIATYIADTTNFEQGNERVQKHLKETAADAEKTAQRTEKLASSMDKAGKAIANAGLALGSIMQANPPDLSIAAPKVDADATSAALATGIAQSSNVAIKASEGLANSAVGAVYKILGGPEAKVFYDLGLQAGKQLAAGMKDGKIAVVNAKEQAAAMAGVVPKKKEDKDGKKEESEDKINRANIKGGTTVQATKEDKKEIKFADRVLEAMDNVKKSIRSTGEYLTQTFIDLPMSIGNIFANAVQNWDGTFKGFFKSIGQGFAQLMQQIAAELIRILVIETMLKIVRGIMGGGTPAPSGTEGVGAVHELGHAIPRADGGLISGPGTATSDSIPAWLSNGEFVMSAKAVSKFGQGFMHRLNNLEMPKFAMGGPVLAGAGGLGGIGGEMFVPSGRMLSQDNSRKSVSNKSTVNNINVSVPRDNPLSTPKSRRQAAEAMLGSLRRYSK